MGPTLRTKAPAGNTQGVTEPPVEPPVEVAPPVVVVLDPMVAVPLEMGVLAHAGRVGSGAVTNTVPAKL